MNKSFTRILVVVLVVSLCCGLFVFPASATYEVDNITDSYWMDVLESFGYSGLDSNYRSVSTSAPSVSFQYNLQETYKIYGFDIVFRLDGEASSVKVNNSTSFEVYKISDGVYRCFGDMELSVSSFIFRLYFTGCTFVEIQSLRLLTVDSICSNALVSMDCSSDGFGTSETQDFSYDYLSNDFESWKSETDNTLGFKSWDATLYCEDWYLYDYIEFYVSFTVDSIDYIYASQDGVEVPVEISYIDLYSYDYVLGDTYCSYISGYAYIRMDVSNCKRSLSYSDIPMVSIGGKFCYLNEYNMGTGRMFAVSHSNCFVKRTAINALYIRLDQIKNQLTSLISQMVKGFSDLGDRIEALFTPSEESAAELEENITGIESNLDEVEDFTVPNYDDVDIDIILSEDNSDVVPFGEFFLVIIGNDYLYLILWISLTLAFLGLLVYGKR